MQVIVYNGHTCQVARTFSRFKDTAFSGVFRQDGRLLAAGSQDGMVQVCGPLGGVPHGPKALACVRNIS